MDKNLSNAVKEAFVRMFQERLTYRDNRFVSFDYV